MSGATAPGKGTAKFTMDAQRPFDSYLDKYAAQKKSKEDPSLLVAEQQAQASTSTSPRKVKRKKSRVRHSSLVMCFC